MRADTVRPSLRPPGPARIHAPALHQLISAATFPLANAPKLIHRGAPRIAMIFPLKHPVDRVRTVGRIEGVSFLLLLGVAMPLKYFADQPLAVTYVGWAHGVLFIALALVTFSAWSDRHLSFGQASLVALGALLPFGPYLIERWLPGHPRHGERLEVPPEISRGLFLDWRDARRGITPAEDLTNPYWCWLIQSGHSSWSVNEHFRGPSSYTEVVCKGGAPCWSAERHGQTETRLADGRTVRIAGEHEDSYDPDFFIYNDILITHPDGRLEILAYPEEDFPPTDFHTTTLVDGKLVLIGNLGYPEQRRAGFTQVLVIDPASWEVRRQATGGEGPGWIHRHRAVLEEGALVISRGEVWVNDEQGLVENFDDWRLDLESWEWSRLTRRTVSIHQFERADGESDHLHDMWMWEMNRDSGTEGMFAEDFLKDLPKQSREEIADLLQHQPPKDPEAYRSLYQPSAIPFTPVETSEEEILETHIEVEGVKVRYCPGVLQGLRLVIEGELPAATEQALLDDLLDKLERVEGAPFRARKLSGA